MKTFEKIIYIIRPSAGHEWHISREIMLVQLWIQIHKLKKKVNNCHTTTNRLNMKIDK